MKEEIKKQLNEKTESLIETVIQDGIRQDNIEFLSDLVEIHTNLAKEDYWKEEKDMRYRAYEGNEYGNYGRRGRYNEGGYGNYGRRGVDAKYRGEEMIDDMYQTYQEYSYGREQYNEGNYSGKQGAVQSLEYMLQSVVDFIKMLKREAGSQEEIELIKRYSKKISEV